MSFRGSCTTSTPTTPHNDGMPVWSLQMTSTDGNTIYNTIDGVVYADPYDTTSFDHEETSISSSSASSVTSVYNFTVWKDELDPYVSSSSSKPSLSSVLPLRTVLNYFERPRSNFIGGPDELKKLQDEDGIVVVVTSIDDCSLHPMVQTSNNTDSSSPPPLQAGDTIHVETHYGVKRNGMIVGMLSTKFTKIITLSRIRTIPQVRQQEHYLHMGK